MTIIFWGGCGNALITCILRRLVRDVIYTFEMKGLYYCDIYGRNRLFLCLVNKGTITVLFCLFVLFFFFSYYNCQQLLF